jgi:hypothetical protein
MAIQRRQHYREDDLQPIMAQLVFEGDPVNIRSPGDLLRVSGVLPRIPWPTHEPRVRMDIQTAVCIASLSDRPLGLVELLTESAPAPLEAHDWPAAPAAVENAIVTAGRYREMLARKVRMARQEQALGYDRFGRRLAERKRVHRVRVLMRVLAWVAIASGVGILVCVALLVRAMAVAEGPL